MDSKSLIRSPNFLVSFFVGIVMTFGSSYIPLVGNLVETIFGAISRISPLSKLGPVGDFIHAYLFLLVGFYLWSLLTSKKVDLPKISLGFIFPYLLFIVVALISVSQIKISF